MDGDFHIAGRAGKVGIPIVAENKNAAFERAVLDVIRAAKRRGEPLRLAGAWRIWGEHAGSSTDTEVQGEQRSRIEGTNPDHVFEIQPVTSVKGLSMRASLRPIQGYSPGTAEVAFKDLSGLPCSLRRASRRTSCAPRQR